MEKDTQNSPAQTRDERIAELLGQPAIDAAKAIKGPSLADLAPMESEVEESRQTETEEEETPTGGKKVRIPASRLKTLTSELDQLRPLASLVPTLQERIAALEARKGEPDEELPDWWKEAYGEDELSKQGYKSQQRIMREEMQRALREQEAQRQREESEREERIESIENSFDEQMENLEEELGRDLTANQKSELLDIVGEYSPQEDGKYIAYMPVSKAYEIWQKGQSVDTSGKKEMARIAGIQSSGNSSSSTQSNERPQWGDWRRRFGG